jgi:uncharacterized SAM-binding protein YcdF (DUF218 family)
MRNREKPDNRRVLITLGLILVLGIVVLFLGLQIAVVVYPHEVRDQQADAALVLGYALNDEDEPDPWLEARLLTGKVLYDSNAVTHLIVSGGKGPRDGIPVSVAMKQWLVSRGIPAEAVLTEEEARSTVENFRYAKRIAQENGIEGMIVVTNDFHILRSVLMAKNILGEPVSFSTAPVPLDGKKVIAYIKEPIAILRYWLLGQ